MDPLMQRVYDRMHKKNNSWQSVFIGMTGTGKSFSAMTCACQLHEKFTIRGNVLLSARAFLKFINSDPEPCTPILGDEIGKWFNSVKEAFYEAEPASALTDNQNVMLTRKGNTLYVHLHKDPETTAVILKPIDTLPKKATLLNTGAALEVRVDRGGRHWKALEGKGLSESPQYSRQRID